MERIKIKKVMKKVFVKTFGWPLVTVLPRTTHFVRVRDRQTDNTCLPAGRYFLDDVYNSA